MILDTHSASMKGLRKPRASGDDPGQAVGMGLGQA